VLLQSLAGGDRVEWSGERSRKNLGSVQSGPKWEGIYRKCPSKFGRQKWAQTMVCAHLAGAQVGNLNPKLEIGGVYILGCFGARRASSFSPLSVVSGFLYSASSMVVPFLGYTLLLFLCYGFVPFILGLCTFLFLFLLCCVYVLVSIVTLSFCFQLYWSFDFDLDLFWSWSFYWSLICLWSLIYLLFF